MRFCKYCGAKLEEGQECTCEEALNAAKAAEEENKKVDLEKQIVADFTEVPVDGEAADKAAETDAKQEEKADGQAGGDTDGKPEEKAEENTAPPAVQTEKSLPVLANTMSDSMFKRGLVLVCALGLGLVLLITVLGNVVGSGYKHPVKNVVKGLNKERSELIINSFYPRDYIEELRDKVDDSDEEWDDVTDDMDSLISDVKEVCEDNYFGDDLEISAKIIKKKHATAKDLRMLKKEFENYDAVVKKAYRIKVRLTVKGDDEKEQVHFYIYSVKLKGGKWVLYPDDKTMGTLSEKGRDIVKDMDKELSEIFSDYSRSLDFVLPE